MTADDDEAEALHDGAHRPVALVDHRNERTRTGVDKEGGGRPRHGGPEAAPAPGGDEADVVQIAHLGIIEVEGWKNHAHRSSAESGTAVKGGLSLGRELGQDPRRTMPIPLQEAIACPLESAREEEAAGARAHPREGEPFAGGIMDRDESVLRMEAPQLLGLDACEPRAARSSACAPRIRCQDVEDALGHG